MSIGADAISETTIGAQSTATTATKGPPPKRTVVATADPATQPEPR
ncbi:MAG: hypothetical protein HOP91_03830 [Sphingomonas sp.]|nr:hypothetical protein [Sphingomonas sp.]